MQPNTLYFGDNLAVLREQFPDACVDLVYLDPPFNSKRDYNYIYRDLVGAGDTAQEQAFTDTWTMEGAAAEFKEVTESGFPEGALIETLRQVFGDTSLVAYLSVMALRLRELHRVLKPTGSLYLHCDPTASHYLKMVLDCVFKDADAFRSEIVWRRGSGHNKVTRQYGPMHDVILFYAKSKRAYFSPVRCPVMRGYVDEWFTGEDDHGPFSTNKLTGPGTRQGDSGKPWSGFDPTSVGRHWAIPREIQEHLPEEANGWSTQEKLDFLDAAGHIYIPREGKGQPKYIQRIGDGKPAQDIWAYQPYTQGTVYGTDGCIDDDVKWVQHGHERMGFQTQKPLGLLERIIKSSSNPGDLICDPFCGCGTAVAAAQALGRQWCGIDITSLAVTLIRERLSDHFPEVYPTPGDVPVNGLPKDVAGATMLFNSDPYDFQFWALTLVGAHPPGGTGKKGADKGIDGVVLWHDGAEKLQRAFVSVKGGKHVSVNQLKDLLATLETEKAAVGLFVTLTPPTKPMRDMAALAGDYTLDTQFGELKFPKLQILTIKELLAGKRPRLPQTSQLQGHKAAKAIGDKGGQQSLFGDGE